MEYSDLAVGDHTFRVRAVDLARNVEHPPVTHAFSTGVDATAARDDPPGDRRRSTTATTGPRSAFTSNEPDATFECALDAEPPPEGAVFEECFSPAQFVELEPGQHTFQVRAVDAALNADPTPGDLDVDVRAGIAARPRRRIQTTPPNPSLSIDRDLHLLGHRSGDRVRVRARRRAVRRCEIAVPGRWSSSPASTCSPCGPSTSSATSSRRRPPTRGGSSPRRSSRRSTRRRPNRAPATPTRSRSRRTSRTRPSGAASPRTRALHNTLPALHLAAHLHRPARRRVPLRGHRGQRVRHRRRAPGRVGVRGRERARHDHRRRTDGHDLEPDRRHRLPVERAVGRGDLRVHPRRRSTSGECLSPFMLPDLSGTSARLPDARWRRGRRCVPVTLGTHTFTVAGRRRRGQHRPHAGQPHVDGHRGRAARDDDRLRARRLDDEHQRHLHVLRRPRPVPRSGARSTGPASPPASQGSSTRASALGDHSFSVVATDADGVADPTPASYGWVDRAARHDRAGHDDRPRPAGGDEPHRCHLPVRRRARRHLRVLARRRRLGRTAAPRRLHEPRRRRPTRSRCGRATSSATSTRRRPSTSWTVDLTDPETPITAQPSDPSRGAFVSFGLAGTDDVTAAGVLDFQCRLDDAPWVDCASPKSYTDLAAGPHTFAVPRRSTRPATSTRRRPPTPGSSTPPIRRRPSPIGPASTTTQHHGRPDLHCRHEASTFECALDGAPCSGLHLTRHLHGSRRRPTTPFAVRAIDAAGNVDQSPATLAWTVDVPPDTTIDSGPAAATGQPRARTVPVLVERARRHLRVRARRRPRSAPARRRSSSRRLDDRPARAPASGPRTVPATSTPAPTATRWTVTPAPEYDDRLGRPDMGVDLQTESTSVDLHVLAPTSPTPRSSARSTSAEFAPCTSPGDATPASRSAPHDFEVQAVGPAGNVEPTPAAYGWEIGDLTPPVVTITDRPDAIATETRPRRSSSPSRRRRARPSCSARSTARSPRLRESPDHLHRGPGQRPPTARRRRRTPSRSPRSSPTSSSTPTPALWEWTIEDLTAPETVVVSGPPAEIVL